MGSVGCGAVSQVRSREGGVRSARRVIFVVVAIVVVLIVVNVWWWLKMLKVGC